MAQESFFMSLTVLMASLSMLIDWFWFRFYELASTTLSPFIPFVFPGPTASLVPPRTRTGASEYVVMITGASAGIGRDLTFHLAKSGYYVFAGVRKTEDGDSLLEDYQKMLGQRKSSLQAKIRPITLDVTNQAHIDDAYSVLQSYLQATSSSFVGLINNAGVFHVAPIELYTSEAIKDDFNTNILGVINLTRKMLPLLRTSPGSRVICMGSELAWMPLAGMGIYCAIKACIRAFTLTLDEELRGLGHRALLIEPGVIRSRATWNLGGHPEDIMEASSISESDFPKESYLLSQLEKNARQYYERLHSRWKVIGPLMRNLSQNSEVVTYDIMHALQSRWPMKVYYPGLDAKVAAIAGRFVPELLYAPTTLTRLAEMTGSDE